MSTASPQPLSTTPTESRVVRYSVDFGPGCEDAAQVTVEYFWTQETPLPVVWFCLPGGGMNRRFYDLESRCDRFSYARQMAARGFVCVLVDLPGTGASDRPEDGFALTPQRLVKILARVHKRVLEDLGAGRVGETLPAMSDAVTVGLGHSMGAMLTILQQHENRSHAAVALLGFGTHGLPQYLPQAARELAQDSVAVRAQIVPLAREMFSEPYPTLSGGGDGEFYGGAQANPDAVKALQAARDRLLAVPAFMSMLPGNVAPEAAAIDVPVFLALGELDFVERSERDDAGFEHSPDVQQLLLPATGHSFFLFDSRVQLFDGLARWARALM